MIIRKLKLRNFRNYEDESIEFSPSMNVITGENAQGKTNLLESLVYLSLTRSHRISDDRKLIREGCEFADITCLYEDGSEKEIEAIIHSKGKTLKVRNQPVRRSSEFIGLFNVVLFAPDDLRMFSDAPQERRRVMNQEITKISPLYLLSLNRYQNLLKERNLILKNPYIDETYLDTLDERMAEEEVMIVTERRKFVKGISEWFPELYKELSISEDEADVKYSCCTESTGEALKADLLQMHRSSREKDLERRTTTSGIHREDMIFLLNGKNLIQTASQGQKRMSMLVFKMALMRYIKAETGKSPVLLLDDVLSELDRNRQKKLLEMVTDNGQCILTATELPEAMQEENVTEFRICEGKVTGGRNE